MVIADIFLFSGNLTAHADDMFINIVEMQENKKNNVILFLQTLGGVPDIGYRIARYLKNEYKNVYYAIGGLCKSTGTLMSISANTLIMGKRGEFGPLDIQIAKKDEVGELASGLNIFQALEFLDEQARSIVANTFVELRNGQAGCVLSFCIVMGRILLFLSLSLRLLFARDVLFEWLSGGLRFYKLLGLLLR